MGLNGNKNKYGNLIWQFHKIIKFLHDFYVITVIQFTAILTLVT